MKTVLRALCCAALLAGFASLASAASMTMTGAISDSNCGASHKQMMTEHKDIKTAHDCTLGCVKAGAKFVFVSGGKVYQIANQDDPDLMTHAGHRVSLTGDMKGDTITVTKVAMVAPKKE